jgi:hypothetical protein
VDCDGEKTAAGESEAIAAAAWDLGEDAVAPQLADQARGASAPTASLGGISGPKVGVARPLMCAIEDGLEHFGVGSADGVEASVAAVLR